MKLSLAEPKYLKESITIISELVNDALIKVTPNAIELVAMDPANVAMVIFKLLSSSFTEYDVKEEIKVGINLNNLKQILRRAKPNDEISMELSDNNKLKIQLKSNTTRTFSIPLLEIEEKEQKIPQLEFSIDIKTNSEILNEAIEDVDIVADSVSLIGDPSKIVIEAEGDLNRAIIEVKGNENTKINAKTQDKVKSKYSIEYLKKMIAGSKLSDEVMISFSKDYPIKLGYRVVDVVDLSFILAPRVENE